MSQSEQIPFQSVLIFGMGMMGASLAKALRELPAFRGKVSGVVRSEKSATAIRSLDLADEVFRVDESAHAADWPAGLPAPDTFDLIVLGMPIRGAQAMLGRLARYRGLVTDMSSTGAVARHAEQFAGLRFVGSHPMCGSADSGPAAAVRGLFQNRLCLILDRTLRESAAPVAPPPTYAADLNHIEQLWRALGMYVFRVDADRHDRIVAYLSHGPHLISGLLARWAGSVPTVTEAIRSSPIPITGGGFKDMARIAGSNPEMWIDILATNRAPVVGALRSFRDDLDTLILRLENGAGDATEAAEWLGWFRAARRDRNFLCGYDEEL